MAECYTCRHTTEGRDDGNGRDLSNVGGTDGTTWSGEVSIEVMTLVDATSVKSLVTTTSVATVATQARNDSQCCHCSIISLVTTPSVATVATPARNDPQYCHCSNTNHVTTPSVASVATLATSPPPVLPL